MDASRFDTLVKSFVTTGTRRALLRLLAPLPVAAGLAALLGDGPEATAKDDDHGSSHRQHRRKAKHRHRTGNNKEHRKGKRKGKRNRKRTGQDQTGSLPPTGCTPESVAQTCGSQTCGTAVNTCGQTVRCTGCTGCCSGNTCMAGTTPEFCEKSGADCQACPAPTGGTAVCQADRSCAKTCPADNPILCGNGSQTCEGCCGLNTGCAAVAGCVCARPDEGLQDCANVNTCTCVDVCEDCPSTTKVCLPFGSSTMCPGSHQCCARCRAS